jgi:molecular chaperone DnaJ
VDTGNRLRLEGEGEAGETGGPPGDLYVVLRVREHEFFQREGVDLHCQIPVSYSQAALGTEIQVPTLRGPEKLRVPAATQSGTLFRLRGQGVPQINGRGAGNLYVAIIVRTPTHLSKKQRELLEQLAEAGHEDVRSPDKSLFEKVKDLFS